MSVLKIGSKGDDVKKLQRALGLVDDGIFGKDTEAAVKKFQKEHNLVDDGIAGSKTLDILFAESKPNIPEIDIIKIDIIKLPINVHISKKSNRQIKYLVVHYTAGSSSVKGSARANRNIFLSREASADFVIDDEEIIQVNPDIKNYYCWAVGDGKGKYGITNSNTISIELCSCRKSGTTASMPNHNGWYFTDAVLENARKLILYIMNTYNIQFKNIVTHYDASRKYCPGLIGWNNGYIYDAKSGNKTSKKNNTCEWEKFKRSLNN